MVHEVRAEVASVCSLVPGCVCPRCIDILGWKRGKKVTMVGRFAASMGLPDCVDISKLGDR